MIAFVDSTFVDEQRQRLHVERLSFGPARPIEERPAHPLHLLRGLVDLMAEAGLGAGSAGGLDGFIASQVYSKKT